MPTRSISRRQIEMRYKSESIEHLESHRNQIVHNLNRLDDERRQNIDPRFYEIDGLESGKIYFPKSYRRFTRTRPAIEYSQNPDLKIFKQQQSHQMYHKANYRYQHQQRQPQQTYRNDFMNNHRNDSSLEFRQQSWNNNFNYKGNNKRCFPRQPPHFNQDRPKQLRFGQNSLDNSYGWKRKQQPPQHHNQLDGREERNRFGHNPSINGQANNHALFDSCGWRRDPKYSTFRDAHAGSQRFQAKKRSAPREEVRREPKRFKCPDGPQTPPYEFLKTDSDTEGSFDHRQRESSMSSFTSYQSPNQTYASNVNCYRHYGALKVPSTPQSYNNHKRQHETFIASPEDSALRSISASPLMKPDSTCSDSQAPHLRQFHHHHQEKIRKIDNLNFLSSPESEISNVISTSGLPVTPSPKLSEYSYSTTSTVMSYEEQLKKYYEHVELPPEYWMKLDQKLQRKEERDANRLAKENRKSLLRQEIQLHIDAGVSIDDDEVKVLSKMRHINLFDADGQSIFKSRGRLEEKKVSVAGRIFPYELSPDEASGRRQDFLKKRVSKYLEKTRLEELLKPKVISIPPLIVQTPPSPPAGSPPKHLPQPTLKIFSQENLRRLASNFSHNDLLGFKVFDPSSPY